MSKRCAIVGTAPSWTKTPWADPTLEIWGINDGYCSRDQFGRGMPRADRWFDIHPLDKMYFRKASQKVIRAEDVPPGYYIRPEGHIEWLREQAKTIPVYLQNDPPEGWPVNAKRFPLEQVEDAFGAYWASGPAYMVALAMIEGYTEIHIYGIHLATQAEYIEQRANFEHLLGIARGRGITIVMAEESPVLKHPWKYAYEPKPQPTPNPARQAMKQELKAIQKRKEALVQALVAWPLYKRKGPALEELRRVQVIEYDLQQQLTQQAQHATVTAMVVAA